MPRALARGRPGSTIIPPAWESQHGIVANRTMTATVELREVSATGMFDDDSQTTLRTNPLLWSGAARIQALNATAGAQQSAEQSVTTGDYRVSIPRTLITDDVVVHVRVGHQIKVTGVAEDGDPDLVGRIFVVGDIRRGSLIWQRDLICTDDETRATP